MTSQQETLPFSLSDFNRSGLIGCGVNSKVFKLSHRTSGQLFALKVIYGECKNSGRGEIIRRIEFLADLGHPNVVRCHRIFENNGLVNLQLEFMDGGSLHGPINDESKLSGYARDMLSGIAYLHGRNIVHGDIEPSNLLRDSSDRFKIAELCVARILGETEDPHLPLLRPIYYRSPERVNPNLDLGQSGGRAGDIWGLGICMLEFYSGRLPFSDICKSDWLCLMNEICDSSPPEAPPSATEDFRHFIACCLRKEPDERWTAEQLLSHPFILKTNRGDREVEDSGAGSLVQPVGQTKVDDADAKGEGEVEDVEEIRSPSSKQLKRKRDGEVDVEDKDDGEVEEEDDVVEDIKSSK